MGKNPQYGSCDGPIDQRPSSVVVTTDLRLSFKRAHHPRLGVRSSKNLRRKRRHAFLKSLRRTPVNWHVSQSCTYYILWASPIEVATGYYKSTGSPG